MENKTFFYFAYGSNLLTERIHINNPSARAKGIGVLKDYKLDFNNKSKKWGGAVATIVEAEGESVWGVLWELDMEHMATLDKQEGVPRVYNRRTIQVLRATLSMMTQCDQVEREDGASVEAVTYVMVRPLVEDRRPSQLYHSVILEGAREHGLPSHYMETLTSIEHNGDTRGDGSVNITIGRF